MNKRKILKFINTEAGRYLIGLRDGFPIVDVHPSSFTQVVDRNKHGYIYRSTFYSGNFVNRIFLPILEKVRIMEEYEKRRVDYKKALLHFSGLQNQKGYPHIFLSSTFNPESGNPATHACDGAIWYSNAGSFATAHDASTGTSLDPGGGVNNIFIENGVAGTYYIARGLTFFNTAALTAAASILSAIYSIYNTNKGDNDSESISIVNCTIVSNVAYATSDYGSFGTTKQAPDKTIASLTLNTYADYTLNATGLTSISKTGITKFGIRTAKDVSNTAPVVGDNNAYFNSADAGSNVPKLVVTFSLGGGVKNMFSFL